MNSQSENNTQQNSAMDMLRKKNTRTLSELEQIPYQPQVYAIQILLLFAYNPFRSSGTEVIGYF